MRMFLLITRPRYDKETHYLYYWTESLVGEAESKHWQVFNLEKEKAIRQNVESYLKKHKPQVIVFNGHGNEACVMGQDGDILLEANINTELLKGAIVYMRACDAGKLLGPDAIEKGARNFIGYEELFRFWARQEKFHKPLEDDYAKPFLECSNQVVISLIKGKTAEEAQADSMALYKKSIGKLLTSESSNSFLVPDLIWNMVNQVCL